MIKRWISALVAIPSIGNGLYMLAAGAHWYQSVPSVSDTGPYNPHFVSDVGAAYLVCGLALAARAWKPAYWPAAVTGALFFCAHSLIHVLGLFGGHSHHAGFEIFTVVLPSFAALWAAFPSEGELND